MSSTEDDVTALYYVNDGLYGSFDVMVKKQQEDVHVVNVRIFTGFVYADNISYTVFYRGYTKIYLVHEKSCIGRGEAEPNTTFFHGPNIFSYTPCKTPCNELIPPKACFKIQLFT